MLIIMKGVSTSAVGRIHLYNITLCTCSYYTHAVFSYVCVVRRIGFLHIHIQTSGLRSYVGDAHGAGFAKKEVCDLGLKRIFLVLYDCNPEAPL